MGSKLNLNNQADFIRATAGSGGRVLQQFNGLKDSEWDIQEASYNGIQFMVLVSKVNYQAAVQQIQDAGGRRKVKYQFPYVDGQTTDDLGRKAESFVINGIFFGNNYLTGFKALFTELQKPEPGILVHPVRGQIQCVLEDFQITHQDNERKAMRIQLTFIEHNFTIGSIESIAEDTSVKSALSKAVDAFASIDSAIANVQGTDIFIRSLRTSISDFMTQFKGLYTLGLADLNKTFNPGGSIDIPGMLPLNQGGNVDQQGTRTTDTFATVAPSSEVFSGVNSQELSPETAAAVAGIELQKRINELRILINQIIAQLSQGEGALEFNQEIKDFKAMGILLQQILERGLASSRAQILNYTTPTEMTVREVAFANGIDVDNVIDIEILNPSLQSVNQIPKGTVLKVPVA